jgi:hypothetical protein
MYDMPRHFHVVLDVRVLDLHLSNIVMENDKIISNLVFVNLSNILIRYRVQL